MLRSLYTGISGLRSHQTMMDVTGNNIANVNTTGYKTANTIFEDTLSQTLANAGAPAGQQGGTNPAQVGLGVRVAGITTNFSQGATQVTGRNTDMLVDGDGFFVVRQNGINQYTRNGSFNVDGSGTLVNLNGAQVQGWQANANGAVNTSNNATPIQIPIGQLLNPKQTDNVVLNGSLDNTIAAFYDGTGAQPVPGDTHTLKYPVFDKNGVSNDVTVQFRPKTVSGATPNDPKTGLVNEWEVVVSYPGMADATKSFKADYGTAAAPNSPPVLTLDGSTDLRYLVENAPGSDGVTTFDFNLDLSQVAVTNRQGTTKSDARAVSQDGAPASTLSTWKVGPDGTIIGTFNDGRTQALARIAVANFDNPAGLSKNGSSTYSATVNSGDPAIGSPGENGRGSLVSGALEMSNVDLAQEFTNLIVSQRGFQANSRIITTSDEMLQELVNLKR